ncbi:hypothetical protein [Paenibacillus sp. NEAU-GSW1]|uniref:hypothetical protein n=1 Tax=Paenibacillus sp. NEAU-GSW1 TaxID=2682486 RepID=UPI001565CAFE|nr:hypothetical protein [Paenibacillus sp. NEAU-GSW1]
MNVNRYDRRLHYAIHHKPSFYRFSEPGSLFNESIFANVAVSAPLRSISEISFAIRETSFAICEAAFAISLPAAK